MVKDPNKLSKNQMESRPFLLCVLAAAKTTLENGARNEPQVQRKADSCHIIWHFLCMYSMDKTSLGPSNYCIEKRLSAWLRPRQHDKAAGERCGTGSQCLTCFREIRLNGVDVDADEGLHITAAI